MTETEDGYYFECEPVEERGNKTKIKEVIEIRYPNLNLKISDETKQISLIGLIISGMFLCCYILYISYNSILKIGMALILIVLFILLILALIGIM